MHGIYTLPLSCTISHKRPFFGASGLFKIPLPSACDRPKHIQGIVLDAHDVREPPFAPWTTNGLPCLGRARHCPPWLRGARPLSTLAGLHRQITRRRYGPRSWWPDPPRHARLDSPSSTSPIHGHKLNLQRLGQTPDPESTPNPLAIV